MIILLFFLIEDSNTLYLMDESFTLFPPSEETLFTYHTNAIRTVQGCLDIDRWYQRYEAGIKMPLFSNLSMAYHLYKEDDYDFHKETHSFELQWIPEGRRIPLSFSFLIAPTYLKRNDMIGLSVGYWKNQSNNHSVYLIVEDFDHNYALSKKTDSLEDPYRRFPIRIELIGTIRNRWAFLSYRYHYTIPGKKDFYLFDESIGKEEYGGMSLSISSYYSLFKDLSFGLRLRYTQRDSFHISYEPFEDFGCDWEHLFAEPFLYIRLFKRDDLRIGFPMDFKEILSDSLQYKRRWFGITLLYYYHWRDWLTVPLGVQKSWRLNEVENQETRGVLGLDFRFNQRTYLAIREGIELDTSLSNIFKNPHNHTFVMLSHRF